jgi:NADPH:quinone reductase-like Zn-dependent oxidoreductase
VIYDILGKGSFSKFKGSLKENGTYLLASFKTGKVLQMIGTRIFGKKKVICAFASEKQEDMAYFKELVENGKVKAVMDRTFTMDEAAEAHRYVESGKKKGNVAITMVH